MKPVEFGHGLPRELPLLNPGAPLWQRVPTRDDDGRPLTDFMMLVPRLREQPQSHIATTLRNIQSVLEGYRDVVFADFTPDCSLECSACRSAAPGANAAANRGEGAAPTAVFCSNG